MLKGSDKQISWAKAIRVDRLAQWQKSDPEVFKSVEQPLKNETSASWWITQRTKSLSEVIPFIVAGGEKKDVAKPKVASGPSTGVSQEAYTALADVLSFVGELRDVTSGELAVNVDCPF